MFSVLIVDKFSGTRSGLIHFFGKNFSGIRLNEATTSHQIFEMFDKGQNYDLIILSDVLEETDTYCLVRKIRQLSPITRILLLADHFKYAAAVTYFINGANGYITKTTETTQLIAAIKAQINQEPFICKELADMIETENRLVSSAQLKNEAEKVPICSPFISSGSLSKREHQIVSYLILGESTTNIAKVFNLKLSTVSTHKSKIYLKLGVSNIVALKTLVEGGKSL